MYKLEKTQELLRKLNGITTILEERYDINMNVRIKDWKVVITLWSINKEIDVEEYYFLSPSSLLRIIKKMFYLDVLDNSIINRIDKIIEKLYKKTRKRKKKRNKIKCIILFLF